MPPHHGVTDKRAAARERDKRLRQPHASWHCLTSFEFCCGSKMPTGSCEVQAEQLPTPQADPDSKNSLL